MIRQFPVRPEWIEFLLGLLAGAIAVWGAPHRIQALGRTLRRSARRRTFWIAVFALLGPCLRLVLLPLAPVPSPAVHDDYVYLLAADTLMHGRLANPPHPFPRHFETIYVFQRPTYSAEYPLGIPVFQAIGWKLTGRPWAGMWMAMALCCGAVTWMLYRWLAPVAAWTGGLLFSLVFGISSYWMNSYYGGSVPAAGGALVFGALPAVASGARLRYAAILSVGWSIIWFSRPYESLIVGLIVFAVVMHSAWRSKGTPRLKAVAAAVALVGAVVILDFAGFCYHNWRVTGDPLMHPYRLSQLRYGVPSRLFWQKPLPEPVGLTPQQEGLYQWTRSLAHRGGWRWPDLKKIWALYFGYPLTIPLVLGCVSRSPKVRALLLVAAICLGWSLLVPETQPHYVAASTAVFFALTSRGILRLSGWRPDGRRLGLALAIGFCAGWSLASLRVLYAWYQFGGFAPVKPAVAVSRQLESTPGRHLVFVRYGPHHNIHEEWVYNRADIDHAKVVWANDLGKQENEKLISYFGKVRVWLVQPDLDARLAPYP